MKNILLITLIWGIYPALINSQTIEDICQTHIERLGGTENIQKINSIYIEQTIYSNNREIPQSTIIVPNKVYYQEVNFPQGKNVISVVEGQGWMINPFVSSKAKELTEKESNSYMINSNIFGPLYDYHTNKEGSDVRDIQLEGETQIKRKDCYKLKVTYQSGFIVTVYISKKDYMIQKVENDFGTMEYSDYKKVDHVMFPFYVEISNKMGVMIGEVIKLKTNIKIDYAKFSKP